MEPVHWRKLVFDCMANPSYSKELTRMSMGEHEQSNLRGGFRVISLHIPHSQLRTLAASTAMPVPATTPATARLDPGSPWANW